MSKTTLRPMRVWVGFSDGVPHWDEFAEGTRQPGYTVCKSRAKCAAIYEDVRPMMLVPVARKRK